MDMNDAQGAAVDTAVVSEAPADVTSTPAEQGSGSIDDSIDRAFAQVDGTAAKATETQQAKPTAQGERARGPDGKFIEASTQPVAAAPVDPAKPVAAEPAKTPSPLDEPPARFSPDAKAAWATAPESIRGEVKRAFTEMESGLQQYQQQIAPIKPFIDMAAKSGTTLDAALTRYTNMEGLLRQDPIKGLQAVCDNIGISLRDAAAHVLGQPADQQASQSDATIRDLRQHITRLEQQVTGVATTFEQQQTQQLQSEIATFSAAHPRFDELRPTIAQLLENGMAHDLPSAYDIADRIKPAAVQQVAPATQVPGSSPAPTAQAAQPAVKTPDLAAQTRKGSLSVTGAPSSGSNPANRKPSSSPDESIDRAFAAVGLG